jgi:hypothetical protein
LSGEGAAIGVTRQSGERSRTDEISGMVRLLGGVFRMGSDVHYPRKLLLTTSASTGFGSIATLLPTQTSMAL